ncbi:TRAP transporter substrate-binding protein [Breoghania sp.]|uniref:TRAP transporter substrate-binding protein n=1 Tax=Breoghania sp. TaxID=2065378 RepID=UPI002AA85EFC|nr:TRAP transporter substrate-binding protein [Breoghania sp.]
MDRREFLKKAGVGTAGGAAVALAAPAVHAQGVREMMIVSSWPRDFPGPGTGSQRLAQRIEKLSEGRLAVKYFAAGERVGAFDVFDEVASGNAHAYTSADYYWKGKQPGFAYFTSVPFGLTYAEMDSWMKFGGGQQLWDELSDGYGIKPFPSGNTGAQMAGWFNKEVNSIEDLNGLKMRIPGLGGDIMSKLGVAPVSLPASQSYEALVSGAIDAAEWIGPWNDYFLKYYEVAKYYYYPGMHEAASQLSMGVNKSWFMDLPEIDRDIIEAACMMENSMTMAEFNYKSGIYLDKLINEHGVNVRGYSEDIIDAIGEAADEVFATTIEHSDLTRRIHESFVKARAELGRWMVLSDAGYTQQRNRVLGITA